MQFQQFALPIAFGLIVSACTLAISDVVVMQNERQLRCDSIVETEKEVRCKIGSSTISLTRSKVARILQTDQEKEKDRTKAPSDASAPPVLNEASRQELSMQRTSEGFIRMKKKQYPEAIRSFQEAYNLSRNQKTVTNLAIAYYYSSDPGSAKSYFGEALLMDPQNTLVLNALGLISAEQGDFTSADSYWRKSYALKPDPAILNNLEALRNRRSVGTSKMFSGINSEEIERTVANYDQDSETHFRIKYDGGTVNPVLLREILRSLDDTYEKLRFDLAVELATDLEVILYPKKDFLQITGAPDWSGGFNDGRIHIPVGGLDSINADVVRVIVHELTHSLLDLKTGGRSPTWLQEGLAQYIDGSRSSNSDIAALANLLNADALPQIHTLGRSFMGANQTQARIQYSASLAFVQFLVERHRFDSISDLLNRIQNGQTIQRAARMAFGADLPDLEEQWRETLRSH